MDDKRCLQFFQQPDEPLHRRYGAIRSVMLNSPTEGSCSAVWVRLRYVAKNGRKKTAARKEKRPQDRDSGAGGWVVWAAFPWIFAAVGSERRVLSWGDRTRRTLAQHRRSA